MGGSPSPPPGRPGALNLPRPVRVQTRDGLPVRVRGEAVEHVRESWLVEGGWWSERPIRRHYFELVSERGRNVVVFFERASGAWFSQAA
ncbi:MAG: hypothetical protein KGJ43_03565 [Acidobacteriota bacterium]|nr:hypothetical protein [Acidobacteriota bacterium]